ncbi:MAG: DUF2341 domain-containing protein [Bradymonadaceae bacterium]
MVLETRHRYGAPAAEDVSSGKAVFQFFEDFSEERAGSARRGVSDWQQE